MTALGLIPSWAWRWIALGLVLVSAAGFGWVQGNEHGTAKLTEYIGKEAAASVVIVTKQGKVTEKVVTKYVKVVEHTADTTMGIKREVIRYVESNPGACLDDDWRRLHDAASANTITERPAGAPDPVRTPPADPRGAGDDGLTRTGGGDGQLREASPLR